MNILVLCGAAAIATSTVAAWQVGKRVPTRDLLAVAQATGSPRACLGFISFCLQGDDHA